MGEALEARRPGDDALRYYQARNEQGDGPHRGRRTPSSCAACATFACTTSIGPGATNMVTGAATATVNRLPVLLLPGDLFATRRVAPVLQQLERPDSQDVSASTTRSGPVSRYWDRINRPEQLVTRAARPRCAC